MIMEASENQIRKVVKEIGQLVTDQASTLVRTMSVHTLASWGADGFALRDVNPDASEAIRCVVIPALTDLIGDESQEMIAAHVLIRSVQLIPNLEGAEVEE